MALHSLYCADVPLKTAHSLTVWDALPGSELCVGSYL